MGSTPVHSVRSKDACRRTTCSARSPCSWRRTAIWTRRTTTSTATVKTFCCARRTTISCLPSPEGTVDHSGFPPHLDDPPAWPLVERADRERPTPARCLPAGRKLPGGPGVHFLLRVPVGRYLGGVRAQRAAPGCAGSNRQRDNRVRPPRRQRRHARRTAPIPRRPREWLAGPLDIR